MCESVCNVKKLSVTVAKAEVREWREWRGFRTHPELQPRSQHGVFATDRIRRHGDGRDGCYGGD